jgi:hypothetical protein
MAKTSDILLSEVKWPDVYVRGKKGMNEKHVTDLTLTLKDSDGKWPFPAIIVRPLKAPVAVDPTVAGKPGKAKYELVDGWHRCMAAVEARWKSVPAEVIPMTDAEAALSQLVTNIAHGERLSQEQKYEYIAYLRNDLHIKVETIAKQTGMSIASVSRIATGKQHVPKSKDGKKRK